MEIPDIKQREIMGSGAYGVVYNSQLRDLPCAIKECFIEDEVAKKNIEREVKYLSRVTHKNIVQLFGTLLNKDSKIMIVMELADCGTLYDYKHNKGDYSDWIAISWIRQLAEGLQYLHAMKPKPIIHRDIKTKNLLLTENYRVLKIADFGTVRELATLMTKDYVGTPEYMAPEVLEGYKYSEKSDVYSFGIVLWEVMSRKKPYYHLNNNNPLTIMNVVSKGERPPIKDTKDLKYISTIIKNCWDGNAEKRSSMHNLVSKLSVSIFELMN
ncbi:mitogen-activated protein kinase kinase kinase 7-like [Drosophila innubila]|uniref:mitogen-activated protein kinase kinase kinase 7-like n=1 Tax=Drosophila innubila TaxID=198719 RepID=UPI00148B5592|nr:mitogen-activated protein kinase kinase kinase 7-like [Drosophila innubila]